MRERQRLEVHGIGRAPVKGREDGFQLPSHFQQRLGRAPGDFFYSGTYRANDKTIGFLRIGSFYPSDPVAPVVQLKAEIEYLRANTDGLVLDITRNDGGDANYQDDVTRLFFPTPFATLPERVRPSLTVVSKVGTALQQVRQSPVPDPALIAHVQGVYDEVSTAYARGKRLTPPLYPRNASPYLQPADVSYSKPIVLLVDENTASAAEAFAAVFQDNRRGVVAGVTTQGAGGEIYVRIRGTQYSESLMSFPSSLLVRSKSGAYIQNVGVTPDVKLDYMSKANLVTAGRPYVDAFTQLIVSRTR